MGERERALTLITDYLHQGHEELLKLLDQLGDALKALPQEGALGQGSGLIDQIKDCLAVHSWYEDIFYYPLVRNALLTVEPAPLSPEFMDNMSFEHSAVERHLNQLEEDLHSSPIRETLQETFDKFAGILRGHILREEQRLFPVSEDILGKEMLRALLVEAHAHLDEAPKIRHLNL